jgi:hypothetical protein
MIALHYFVEHPQWRSRIKNVVMDTLRNTIRTTSTPVGAGPRCSQISTNECNSKEKTVIMSPARNYCGPAAEMDEPRNPQTCDLSSTLVMDVLLLIFSRAQIQTRRRKHLQKVMMIRKKVVQSCEAEEKHESVETQRL